MESSLHTSASKASVLRSGLSLHREPHEYEPVPTIHKAMRVERAVTNKLLIRQAYHLALISKPVDN